MIERLINVFNKIFIFLLKFNFQIKIRGVSNEINKDNLISLDTLIDTHFNQINQPNHECKKSLFLALNEIDRNEKVIIIETGSSAWGTNSSQLFDKFVQYKNLKNPDSSKFFTCDIRLNPMLDLYKKVSSNTTLICNDSIKCLKNLSRELSLKNSSFLIYLDSYDLDYKNPNPSGLHGFQEFLSIIPFLKKGTVIIIDDSPNDIDNCPQESRDICKDHYNKFGLMPGKGMFIDPIFLKFKNVKKIFHKYQIVYIVE
jgi:hypothetical protein